MEPLKLELYNYMGHKESIIDCSAFQSALIVAKGVHNDRVSNGAGKSTIFKAIEYVLFGEHDTKTLDEIVKIGADVCKVAFEFKLNNEIYRIERSRNRKTSKSDFRLWVKKNNVWSKDGDLTQKTSTELEHELLKLIKINHHGFRGSVLFAQDDIKSLSSAKSPQERKNILKDVLNLNIYSKLEKLAREEALMVAKQISDQQECLDLLGNPEADVKTLNEQAVELENQTEKFAAEQIEIQNSLNDNLLKLSVLKKYNQNDLPELKKSFDELFSKCVENNEKISSLKELVTNKQSEITISEQKKQVLLQEITLLENSYVTIDDSFSTEELEAECKKLQSSEIKGQSYLLSLKNKLQDLRQPLPEEEICSQCHQTLTNEHRKAWEIKIKQDIKEVEQNYNIYSEKLTKIQGKKDKIEQNLKKIASDKQNNSILNSKIESKKNELKNISEFSQQQQVSLEYLKENYQSQQKLYNDLVSQKESLKEKIKILEKQDLTEKIITTSEAIKALKENLIQLRQQEIKLSTDLGILSEKVAAKLEDLKKYQNGWDRLAELQKKSSLYKQVIRGFSPSGVPTMVIYTILDDLQIEANKFLNKLKPGLELQFTITKNKNDGSSEDTLDMSYRLNGMDLSYELLSGGQKFIVALSLRLGLSMIIQKRLDVNIKFLILDEVDEKLDEATIETLANLLKELQNEFKIMVITHNNKLKDKFSHAILIQYHEKEGSSASVVTSW